MIEETEFDDLVQSTALEISYKPGYAILFERDKLDPEGRWYFQVECERPDVYTGVMGVGRGGKAYLSRHMTRSELVRRAFGLFMAYEEHECREWFKWNRHAVFGPHISVEALWHIATDTDEREPKE